MSDIVAAPSRPATIPWVTSTADAPNFRPYEWTADEAALLSGYVSNLDLPVFALHNLPEAVKGALFARYSRTHKDLRRLLLDEFSDGLTPLPPLSSQSDDSKAAALYKKVLDGFGDDSVAQLGSAHIACEQVSNVLTKVLERGRLMSYLEQSTRYIPYDTKDAYGYLLCTPPDLPAHVRSQYVRTMDTLFKTYSRCIQEVYRHLDEVLEKPHDAAPPTWERTLRSKALDASRGLLPAATVSNLGIHGSGQAFEHLILRLRSHPLEEARNYGSMMLDELRKVIPEFLRRVDIEEYGGASIRYRQDRLAALATLAANLPDTDLDSPSRIGVALLEYDSDAEEKIAAAALFPHTALPEAVLEDMLFGLGDDQIDKVFNALKGNRVNRRHRPGRELEVANYRFSIVGDYASYRDLQRHRMLTIEAQPLTTALGYVTPDLIGEAGLTSEWDKAMAASAKLHDALAATVPDLAPYAVAMAHRLRYVMQFNAREAMHIIELRSQPAGHPSYRAVVQEMLRQIKDVAHHERIAALFTHADMSDGSAGRLTAEKRSEKKAITNP